MKRIVLSLAITLAVACSKDEKITENGQTTTQTSVTTNAVLADEDLYKYYQINHTQNVEEAITTIEKNKDLKTIEGKKIQVNEYFIEKKNEEEGLLIVKFIGQLNGKAFDRTINFHNLVKKPTAYYLATRAYANWKESVNNKPEMLELAFDELYRLKKTDKFTTEYLSQWVDFYSSTPEFKTVYKFTKEDLKHTVISEVEYINGKISFVITYKGTKGTTDYQGGGLVRPSLNFDYNTYYKNQIIKNSNEAKKYYGEGMSTMFHGFLGNFLELKNLPDLVIEIEKNSIYFDRSTNAISMQLIITNKYDKEFAKFHYIIDGFKPLDDLKNEWVAFSTFEAKEYLKKITAKLPDGDVTTKLNNTLANWVHLLEMGVIRNDAVVSTVPGYVIPLTNGKYALKLFKGEGTLNGVTVTAYSPVSTRAIHKDILWLSPYFEVVNAQKTNGYITFTLKLNSVNEVSIKGAENTIKVRL